MSSECQKGSIYSLKINCGRAFMSLPKGSHFIQIYPILFLWTTHGWLLQDTSKQLSLTSPIPYQELNCRWLLDAKNSQNLASKSIAVALSYGLPMEAISTKSIQFCLFEPPMDAFCWIYPYQNFKHTLGPSIYSPKLVQIVIWSLTESIAVDVSDLA